MRRNVLLALWLATDIAVFLGAYALAYFLRVGFILSSDVSFRNFMIAAAVVAPIWLLSLITTRTFALMRKQMSLRTVLYIIYASAMAVSLFALTYYFLFGLFFSRLLLVQAFALSILAGWGWHLLFGFLARHVMRRDPPAYPTLIIGATREAGRLIKALKAQSALTPVAVLDTHAGKESHLCGVPVAGRLHKLESVLREQKITHIIQCSNLEQALNFVSLCKQRGITYLLLPSVLGILEGQERVDMLEGHPVTIVDPARSKWGWFFR